MIDLHSHSNISDGDLSPAVLVEEAAKQGIHAIALTDHDTVKGLESARAAAKRLTDKNENIRLIPGIEVNINWTGNKSVTGLGSGGEFHLLGLGINSPSAAFLTAIQ